MAENSSDNESENIEEDRQCDDDSDKTLTASSPELSDDEHHTKKYLFLITFEDENEKNEDLRYVLKRYCIKSKSDYVAKWKADRTYHKLLKETKCFNMDYFEVHDVDALTEEQWEEEGWRWYVGYTETDDVVKFSEKVFATKEECIKAAPFIACEFCDCRKWHVIILENYKKGGNPK